MTVGPHTTVQRVGRFTWRVRTYETAGDWEIDSCLVLFSHTRAMKVALRRLRRLLRWTSAAETIQ